MAQNDFKTENESRPALIRAMGDGISPPVGEIRLLAAVFS